jgi:uncharacterized protein YndB with AHSA1/START domain
MATIDGESTAEINAPIRQVWELVADVERAPQWQNGLKSLRTIALDRDARPIVCITENDAKVRSIRSTIRFHYEPPTRLSWEQEDGDLKSVVGSWVLEDLGDRRTRATYRVNVDLGFTLGLVIRGPLVGMLRDQLAGARAGELKEAVEARARRS